MSSGKTRKHSESEVENNNVKRRCKLEKDEENKSNEDEDDIPLKNFSSVKIKLEPIKIKIKYEGPCEENPIKYEEKAEEILPSCSYEYNSDAAPIKIEPLVKIEEGDSTISQEGTEGVSNKTISQEETEGVSKELNENHQDIIKELYENHEIKEDITVGPTEIQDETKEPKTKPRLWVNNSNKKREQLGEYQRLCEELESCEDKYYQYFNMSQSSFEHLHELIRPKIFKQDTNYRKAISTKERLAICMRYIRTGDSFLTIASSFRVGKTTASKIVEEVSKAIWECLQPIYMPDPTEEIWKQSELGFLERCNFPNCVGSIDGKYVCINCPNSGSNSDSDVLPDSIVLFAIADPFYKFTTIDIGSYGRQTESNIFQNSTFYKEYLHKEVLLPPKTLPGLNDLMPHVLIGDEGFALQTYLMRPFPKAATLKDPRKQKFNDRLCPVRHTVEKTFAILKKKWRVFKRPLECSVEKAIYVVKAACCLHNYVHEKHGDLIQKCVVKKSKGKRCAEAFIPLKRTNQRSPSSALVIRDNFVTYFNNIGSDYVINESMTF